MCWYLITRLRTLQELGVLPASLTPSLAGPCCLVSEMVLDSEVLLDVWRESIRIRYSSLAPRHK